MICLWCQYADVITYDGISWGEACDMHTNLWHAWACSSSLFIMLRLTGWMFSWWHTRVDMWIIFLWYYDGIANALVACWGVMIDRTPQMGREGWFIWWPRASPYAWGRISNTIWAGDKLNQHYICQWFLCLVYSSWWIALEELWDHLEEAKCLMF